MADRITLFKRAGLAAGAIVVATLVVVLYLWWTCPTTTVVVLRHAEKDTASSTNDDLVTLSPEGHARAQTLAQVLENSGASVIFVTQKLRTQQTAEPLASARNITPTQIDAANTNELVRQVRSSDNRGRVIVVVGHGDTVPLIVNGLGGGTVTVGDNEFDNLFVLTLHRWSATRLIRATYGAPR